MDLVLNRHTDTHGRAERIDQEEKLNFLTSQILELDVNKNRSTQQAMNAHKTINKFQSYL